MKCKNRLWQLKGCLAFIPLVFAGGVLPQEAMANSYEVLNKPYERSIRGKVTDENGVGLPGVTIRIKGTSQGTVTDLEGNYTITVPDEGAVLVFSFVGYVEEEVPVNNRSVVDVSLVPDLKSLEEVVVVGYGTQKKSDITGAISSVSAEEITATPVQNVFQGIQGRAAGVDIASNARPGEIGQIRIRGQRSISGSNDPLYVVDGVPLQSGGIESFNPYDIASIEVLKDASATAIYGSRGANGVVLITTKKGQSGRAELSYNGSVAFEKIRDLSPNFNAAEYADYRREARRNVGKRIGDNATPYPFAGEGGYSTLYPNPADDFRLFGATDPAAWESIAAGYEWADRENLIPEYRPTTAEERALWGEGVTQVPVYNPGNVRNTDWTDYVEKTGVTHNHTLSARMGNEKVRAYISGGYLNQTGTEIGQDYNRYTGLLSLDADATDWLKLGGTVNASYSIQNYGYASGGSRGSRSLYEAAKGQLPYAVPYDNEGNFVFMPGGDVNIINPIRDGEFVKNERTALRAFGSFFGEVRFAEGLRYRAVFGPDIRNYRNGQFQDERSSLRGGGTDQSTNYARYSQDQQVSWTMENLLYYDKTFNEKHKLGVTLLQSSSSWNTESSDITATDVPYNSQLWYNLGSTNDPTTRAIGSGYSKRTLLSYMGRVNYSLMDKYLLTATGRWDGASVLAEGNKWDFFPSMSVAWKMDQEEFLQGVNAINALKLRVGVGEVGSQAVPPYSTAGGLVRLPYVFGSTPASGYVPSYPAGASNQQGSLPNQELGWEKTRTVNFGLDFGLVQGRIRGSVDYYIANTSDILLEKTPLSVTGYRNITVNLGKTRNKGVEVVLNTVNVENDNFQWYTDFTFSRNRTEIVELVNGEEDLINQRLFIGHAPGVFYDYNKIGIWQIEDREEMERYNNNGAEYEPGDIRVEDLNGDYIINPDNDRKIIGSPIPDWTGGMVNTFAFKNLELSAFVYARWGYMVQGGALDMQGRYASRAVDYWTPENPTNEYPRPDWDSGGQPVHYTTMNYQDGSFVKVRYISLSYLLPKSVIDRANISNFKVYAQVLNPFLYSKTDFLDPDSNYQIGGANPSAFGVSTRSLIFGVNMSF